MKYTLLIFSFLFLGSPNWAYAIGTELPTNTEPTESSDEKQIARLAILGVLIGIASVAVFGLSFFFVAKSAAYLGGLALSVLGTIFSGSSLRLIKRQKEKKPYRDYKFQAMLGLVLSLLVTLKK